MCVWVLYVDGVIYLNVYIPSILREQDPRVKSSIFEVSTFIFGIVGFHLILILPTMILNAKFPFIN